MTCSVPTRTSWPLDAYYHFSSYSPSADELRLLVALKDSDACERRKLELQRRTSALDSIRLESPCTFVLRDYYQKKLANEKWVSTPFYTKPLGYKLCLVVHANGTGDGSGTHVSVFVHLMWGEYDNLLKWPFKGTVSVEMLDSLKKYKLHSTNITFGPHTPQKYSKRVVIGNAHMNPNGVGDPQFISHQSLELYIQDDCCLNFHVSSVVDL